MADCTAKKTANVVIHFCNEHGDLVTNLKLQKVVYYAQAWYLALYDRSLFDEPIQAWVHGPVVPVLYREYKQFGFGPIQKKASLSGVIPRVQEHIRDVLAAYGRFSAYDLERLVHTERPWIEARGCLPADAPSKAVIPHDAMRQFYGDLADEAKTNEADSAS